MGAGEVQRESDLVREMEGAGAYRPALLRARVSGVTTASEMGRASEDDEQSDRCGGYSSGADVSGYDSSSDFSGRRFAGSDVIAWPEKPEKTQMDLSEVEMMKERFAKLLLGEDMSGGGKGACTALAISNAITNLSATVFGELWRLEPMAPEKKAMWRREMEWFLCVSDSIVELIPSLQDFPGGGAFEVMVSRSRTDLRVNLPALKKLDAMLIGMLDGFRQTEFWYVDRGVLVAEADEDCCGLYSSSSLGRPSFRQEEKWWLPCPRVPPNGLSEESRRRLQQCRDCTNQILKAAMAINSGVLAEMEIPDAYLETLPKNGKSCVGDIIYRYIKADQFSPEYLLNFLDLSSEHYSLEIANRIEAAMHIWRQKDQKKPLLHSKGKKSSWGKMVLVSDVERKQVLAQRAEDLLQSLRLRQLGLPQTVLDMNKIQYNKDVGQAILESYSRVMESLAFNIMARIEDLIFVDDATKKCAASEAASLFHRGIGGLSIQKKISPSPFSVQNTPYVSPFAVPSFCSSTPVTESPRRAQPSLSKRNLWRRHEGKSGKLIGDDTGRWSYSRNLSVSRNSEDARERD